MAASSVLSQACLEELRRLDTCTASNAIERLTVRLRNEGSISGSALRLWHIAGRKSGNRFFLLTGSPV